MKLTVLAAVALATSVWLTPLPERYFAKGSVEPKPKLDDPAPEAKKVEVGKNVALEVQGEKRRVLINAYVCLRKAPLEMFLTRKRTKEHEAILAAEIDARDVHTALFLARAEQGSPAQWRPRFVLPSGTSIKITVEYEAAGKKARVPAQRWVRSIKDKKDLTHDWVFAGSRFTQDPEDPANLWYAANDGDVICLSNFDAALLDLPIESSSSGAELLFEAHTERIPPVDTAVLVILEPVLAMKQKK